MNVSVKSRGKYLRMSPKKVRPVIAAIRGKSALAAEQELSLIGKGSVPAIKKVLKAAIADAEHNFNAKKESLVVKTASVDEGPRLKRYSPRARGMAHPIMKRTGHITIVLEGEGTSKQPVKSEIVTTKVADVEAAKETEDRAGESRVEERGPEAIEESKETKTPAVAKKIFRRKTG